MQSHGDEAYNRWNLVKVPLPRPSPGPAPEPPNSFVIVNVWNGYYLTSAMGDPTSKSMLSVQPPQFDTQGRVDPRQQASNTSLRAF